MHGKSKEYDPQKLLVAFLFLEQENKELFRKDRHLDMYPKRRRHSLVALWSASSCSTLR